jgi:hypothetical protein
MLLLCKIPYNLNTNCLAALKNLKFKFKIIGTPR